MKELDKVAKQMIINKAMEEKELGHWPTHETHCCPKHRCKYGDKTCPVTLGLTEKHNEHCEWCEEEKRNPDPLALLDAWAAAPIHQTLGDLMEDPTGSEDAYFIEIPELRIMISRCCTEPQAVRKEGIAEGWWPK